MKKNIKKISLTKSCGRNSNIYNGAVLKCFSILCKLKQRSLFGSLQPFLFISRRHLSPPHIYFSTSKTVSNGKNMIFFRVFWSYFHQMLSQNYFFSMCFSLLYKKPTYNYIYIVPLKEKELYKLLAPVPILCMVYVIFILCITFN